MTIEIEVNSEEALEYWLDFEAIEDRLENQFLDYHMVESRAVDLGEVEDA